MKKKTILQMLLEEVIIFGGIPTKRGDVLRWMQNKEFSKQAIDSTVFGHRVVDEEPVSANMNLALQD